MTVTDKYWLQVNKKSFKYDIIAILILSGFLGGISTFGIYYYMLRVISYSMRYLNIRGLFSAYTEGLNQVLIMPFSREQIYKTYIKMILCMSAIFTVIVGLSKLIYTLIYGPITMSSGGRILKPTFFTNASYYLIFFCGLLTLLITLVNQLNTNTFEKGRYNGFLILCPCPALINFLFMLSFSGNPLAGKIYFVLSLVGTVFLILILVNSIKKIHQEFVVKFRRYVHVQ
jgi:hypothetical protein